MATIANSADAALQAELVRIENAPLADNLMVDFSAVNGTTRPENNATLGASFDASGLTQYQITFEGNANAVFDTPVPSELKYDIACNDNTTGTVPKLVTALELRAGVYSELSATMGCLIETDTAILELRKADGSLVKSIERTGFLGRAVSNGFTVTANAMIYFFLRANQPIATALILGVQIK